MKNYVLASCFFLLSSSVLAERADQALLTVESDSRSSLKMFSLDYIPDGDTNAVVLAYELPADAKAINIKNCVSDVSKSVKAICKIQDNKVGVVIYAGANESIGKGLVSIGRVSYRSASAESPKLISSSASDLLGKAKPVSNK